MLDRPKMKLLALQRTREIARTIDALNKEKYSLYLAAEAENGINGLMAMGERKAVLQVTKMNRMCLSGNIKTPGGLDYQLQAEFGVDGYHGNLHFAARGFRFSFSANDGTLNLFISLPNPKDGGKAFGMSDQFEEMLPESCAQFAALFGEFGIVIDTSALEHMRKEAETQVKHYDTLIAAVGKLNQP